MKAMAWAWMPILMLGTAGPVVAAKPKQNEKAAEAPVAVPEVEAADAVCSPEKKEKKKGGLGGLLRAARNSGLLNIVAGQAGAAAAMAGSVANTAVDAADAGARKTAAERERSRC